jgi:hypothetical protein
MKRLFVTNVSELFAEISQLEQVASTSPPDGELAKPWRYYVANIMFKGYLFCADLGLTESVAAAARLDKNLREDQSFKNQELLWKLNNLRELMESEMNKRLYLSVSEKIDSYYAKEHPFGFEVFSAFPSARFDISQAGTCLACGCNTAAAFHLMRAAEIGLWELGRDRQVSSAQNQKIEFMEWGKIIGELEEAIQAIKQWPNSPLKEDAHKFYNHALVEIRAFNDGWRRHTAHVRTTQKALDEDEALALWGHVNRFLSELSGKITEGNHTPLIWT